MARLRITSPETDGHLISGHMARVWLGDHEISAFTSKVVLTVDADSVISAEVTLYIEGVDVDLPAELNVRYTRDNQAKIPAMGGNATRARVPRNLQLADD